jgi:hypothetical protein
VALLTSSSGSVRHLLTRRVSANACSDQERLDSMPKALARRVKSVERDHQNHDLLLTSWRKDVTINILPANCLLAALELKGAVADL